VNSVVTGDFYKKTRILWASVRRGPKLGRRGGTEIMKSLRKTTWSGTSFYFRWGKIEDASVGWGGCGGGVEWSCKSGGPPLAKRTTHGSPKMCVRGAGGEVLS